MDSYLNRGIIATCFSTGSNSYSSRGANECKCSRGRLYEKNGVTLSESRTPRIRGNMTKSKRKPSKFTTGREVAGPPAEERVIPDKRVKPPKHKKDLRESGEH